MEMKLFIQTAEMANRMMSKYGEKVNKACVIVLINYSTCIIAAGTKKGKSPKVTKVNSTRARKNSAALATQVMYIR